MKSKYIIVNFVIVITIMIVAILVLWQISVATLSKSNHNTPQDDIREVVRMWSSEYFDEKEKLNIRSPIGLTTLAGRLYTLDFLKGNCFGVIIYRDHPLESETIENMRTVLGEPCDYLSKDIAPAPERANLIRSLGCTGSERTSYRVVVSVQAVRTKVYESGHKSNDFSEIQREVIYRRQ